MIEVNKIFYEDNKVTTARIPDNFVNLIITSPPYADARKKTYGGIHPDKYIEWFKPMAKEFYRILHPSGSFILNLGDNTVKGETHLYTFEMPIMLKKELGFKFIDPFIWHKKTAPPGKFKNRFKDSWEFCYHFSKTLDLKFNPYSVAEQSKEQSIKRALRHKDSHLMKSETGSGFTNPNKNLQRRIRNNGSGFGTNDERLSDLDLALPGNVLWLAGETTNVGHSAPFPVGIPIFFIKAFTDENDVVYDPFSGSGTVKEVCLRMNRKFIGSEILPEYQKSANTRTYEFENTLF
jgi:DNA modification methylase